MLLLFSKSTFTTNNLGYSRLLVGLYNTSVILLRFTTVKSWN